LTADTRSASILLHWSPGWAECRLMSFARLMSNLGGPIVSVCKMYAGTVMSCILYGAPV